MERDVLVKLDDPIERRLSEKRYERSTHREDDQRNVEMENQGRRSGNRVSNPERSPRGGEIVFQEVVQEAKGKNHSVNEHEESHGQSPRAFIDHPTLKLFRHGQVSYGLSTYLS